MLHKTTRLPSIPPRSPQPAPHQHNVVRGCAVQTGGNFIGKQNAGGAHQHLAGRDTLLLAAAARWRGWRRRRVARQGRRKEGDAPTYAA